MPFRAAMLCMEMLEIKKIISDHDLDRCAELFWRSADRVAFFHVKYLALQILYRVLRQMPRFFTVIWRICKFFLCLPETQKKLLSKLSLHHGRDDRI